MGIRILKGISPFLRDVILTSFVSVITIISMILFTRFLAQGLGAEEFGAYSLARRVVSTVFPFSTLVMGDALARYIALSNNYSRRSGFFLGSLMVVGSVSLITVFIGLIFAPEFSMAVFRNVKYLNLYYATLFMILGNSFYVVLYALYRGQRKMNLANLWQLGVMAVGPLIIAFLFAKQGGASLIIFLMGLLFFVALIPLGFYFSKAILDRPKMHELKNSITELLGYGAPRTPGSLAFAGLLTVGPILAPHFGSLEAAGYLVIGQSVLRVVETGIAGFGIVVLPKVAQIISEGREGFLKDRIDDLMVFIFQVGLFATLHIFLLSDIVIKIWLGREYEVAIPYMRVLGLALIPYIAYVTLRSVIDGVEKKAINTYNLLLSLVITLIFCWLLAKWSSVIGLAIGTTIGFFVLGMGTALYLWKRFKLRADNFYLKRVLVLNALLILPLWVLKWVVVGRNICPSLSLVMLLIFEFLAFGTYFLILRSWDVRWIKEVVRRLGTS